MELLEKLAALVPPLWLHLLRYHGVLAPRVRDRIVPAKHCLTESGGTVNPMSSYGEFKIGPLKLSSSRNCVDASLMWIFRSDDRREVRIDSRDPDQLAQNINDAYLDSDDQDNPLEEVVYRCPVAVVRDRLDLKGFTYENAKSVFQTNLETKIEQAERWRDFHPVGPDATLQHWKSLSLDKWVLGIERIMHDGLTSDSIRGLDPQDPLSPLLQRMLRSNLFDFPGDRAGNTETLSTLRIVAEKAPKNMDVTYDLTDLEGGGWIDGDAGPDDMMENLLYDEAWLIERVIVLTEGEDRRILERSLKLLYPHLADYFRFFDHSATKAGGGVGQLANLVRSFAALDVRQRVIAVFDNDTAGRDAMSTLDLDRLPANITVIQYPDCDIGKDYPTLGPQGPSRMNVNGWAGGIELYLGREVLVDESGELSPVQWTGYNRKLRAYQGEILDKGKIKERFLEKLGRCESKAEEIELVDWDGIREILDALRSAFHKVDHDLLVQLASSELDSD